MQTAFVTGSTGLLGNNLVRLLLAKGWRVKALARDKAKAQGQFEGLPVEVVIGDLREVEQFAGALEDCAVVFHAGAYYRDSYAGGSHAKALHEVNVVGTQRLLQAAWLAGVRRMVHISSVAVLGDNGGALVDESHLQLHPEQVDEYYRSKIEADAVVTDFLARHPEMWISFVLPGWMHGPGDIGPTSAGRFMLDYMQGKLPGVIDAAFSVVDARDVAEIALAAAERGGRGERYLAAGKAMHMAELCQTMETVTGKAAPKRVMPRSLLWLVAGAQELYARLTGRPVLLSLSTVRMVGSDYGRRFSAEKIARSFGLSFRPVEQTLADTLGWYRQQGWL